MVGTLCLEKIPWEWLTSLMHCSLYKQIIDLTLFAQTSFRVRAVLPWLLMVLSCCVVTNGNAARPNIVIIYADDHAQHAISAYGSRINKTPNIDALARDGMMFTQRFVANSICGPSRATLLTGLHSHANGQVGNRSKFRDELPTFAKSLQAAGYATAVVGKWHISTKPNGFDY